MEKPTKALGQLEEHSRATAGFVGKCFKSLLPAGKLEGSRATAGYWNVLRISSPQQMQGRKVAGGWAGGNSFGSPRPTAMQQGECWARGM